MYCNETVHLLVLCGDDIEPHLVPWTVPRTDPFAGRAGDARGGSLLHRHQTRRQAR